MSIYRAKWAEYTCLSLAFWVRSVELFLFLRFFLPFFQLRLEELCQFRELRDVVLRGEALVPTVLNDGVADRVFGQTCRSSGATANQTGHTRI